MMTAGGAVLSSNKIYLLSFLAALLGTALSVASANAFNMIYERETDKFMERTRLRPLVVGKIQVFDAVLFSFSLVFLSFILLYFFVNMLTAVLSLFAVIMYVVVYTPLKYKTPLALVIGAIPGAIPPLLGWTAVNNQISPASMSLFFLLFAWQMPHFISIAINHLEDYKNAGIRVVPAVRGIFVAKVQAFLWTLVLLLASVSLVYYHLAGPIYLVVALVAGIWFLYLCLQGFNRFNTQWSKKLFFASLIYLPVVVSGLLIDRLFGAV